MEYCSRPYFVNGQNDILHINTSTWMMNCKKKIIQSKKIQDKLTVSEVVGRSRNKTGRSSRITRANWMFPGFSFIIVDFIQLAFPKETRNIISRPTVVFSWILKSLTNLANFSFSNLFTTQKPNWNCNNHIHCEAWNNKTMTEIYKPKSHKQISSPN